MPGVSGRIPRHLFLPLPRPGRAAGGARRVGVEIEFGGLAEARAAAILAEALGGRVREASRHELVVEGSEIGDIDVYLDTAFRDEAGTLVGDLGLDLGRVVVPVEAVTEPLAPAALPALQRGADALRAAGASGSRDGLLLGFGLHLNPELAATEAAHVVPVVRSFALLEDWLRNADPIDAARRVLPFVSPYPRHFVDRLAAEAAHWDLAAFIEAYLDETPTRNRGLDMLPVIRHLDEARLLRAIPEAGAISARPAFHYRLPDSRIDEDGWTLAYEWNRWVMVERLAADSDRLETLARDWREYRKDPLTIRADWRRHVERALDSWRLWTQSP